MAQPACYPLCWSRSWSRGPGSRLTGKWLQYPLPAVGHSPETREVARAPEATHKGSLWGRGIPDLPCDAPKLFFLGWALWMHKRKRIFFSFPPELKSTVGKHPGSLGTLCISLQTETPKPYGSSQGSFTLSASVYPFPAAATFPPSTWWVVEIPRGALGVTRRRGSTRRGVPRGWGRGRLPGSRVSGMRGHELRCWVKSPGARGPGWSRVWGDAVRWGGLGVRV